MSGRLLISDARTGRQLAVAENALVADEKARELEAVGHTVAITPAPAAVSPAPAVLAPAPVDVPDGYQLLEPRHLAASTLAREPGRWVRQAERFPAVWGRWGEGQTTANVAHACHDRGLIEIAVPITGRGPFLYRQKRGRA